MPGFMGLRGMEQKNAHDMDKERRQERRPDDMAARERRSQEKVREVLRDQSDTDELPPCPPENNDGSHAEGDRVCRLPVAKIMSGRVATLTFDDSLLTAQGIFSHVNFRHLPIVNKDGDLIGILSDRDVLRMSSPFFGTINEQTRDKEIMGRKVGIIMTRNPVSITPDTSLLEAIRLMDERRISCLPVVAEGGSRLLGIITWKDVVRAFCPKGFSPEHDSGRLRAGEDSGGERCRVSPDDSVRMRMQAQIQAAAAESARLRAAPEKPPATSQPGRPAQASVASASAAKTGNHPPSDSVRLRALEQKAREANG